MVLLRYSAISFPTSEETVKAKQKTKEKQLSKLLLQKIKSYKKFQEIIQKWFQTYYDPPLLKDLES